MIQWLIFGIVIGYVVFNLDKIIARLKKRSVPLSSAPIHLKGPDGQIYVWNVVLGKWTNVETGKVLEDPS